MDRGLVLEVVRMSMSVDEGAAFMDVAARYWDPIARLAFHLLGTASDAAKATEDALLLARDRPEPSVAFRPFVYRTAIRLALERRRPVRRALDGLLPRFDVAGNLAWPREDWPQPTGETEDLREGLDQLPGLDCAALVLRKVEQFSTEEAADFLEIPAEEVRRRTHRSLLFLTCFLGAARPRLDGTQAG
jgi:DNA-directed RNA polymerase specialized sigma24 family protein